MLYGYLVGGGLLVTLLAALVLAPVPWAGADRLRRAVGIVSRQRFRIGVVVLYLVALVVVGLVIREPGRLVQVVVVPVSAVVTVVAIGRLARRPARRWSSRAVVAVVAVAALLVAAAFVLSGGGASGPTPRRAAGSLFLVAGADTASGDGALFHLDPATLGYSCAQTFYFSYAGTGPGAGRDNAVCPIRRGAHYTKSDTERPLGELQATFLAQLAGLPRPVVVVTHSEGAWIAWAGLSRGDRRAAGVAALVMLAPFNSALAPYPRAGQDGRGAVGGAAVRLVTHLGQTTGFSTIGADAPLVRELQATPGAVGRLFAQPLDSGVRAVALLSRFDLPLVPDRWPSSVQVACPGWVSHGAQPTSPTVLAAAARFLRGEDPAGCPSWVRDGAAVTEAFGAPPAGS